MNHLFVRRPSVRGAALVLAACLAGPSAVLGTSQAASAAESTGPDTVLVSVAADGGAANGHADRPEISGDGRYVTFDSNATNLTAGIPFPERRIYRRDLATGVTELVSASSTGAPAASWSSFSWPSDDGNLIAFVSDDFTLSTPSATSRAVYLRDMNAATTELVSVSSTGRAANGASSRPMVSPDGRFVAFSSYASNLTPQGNPGNQEQVFLRDRVARTTTLVSVSATGSSGNARSYRGMVSADGRLVAFASTATNLADGANPAVESIFVRDLVAGTTRRVSVRADGTAAPLGGSRPYLSPDGRHAMFNSYDPLVPADTDKKSDVYLVDLTTGAPERQSVSTTGGNSNGDSLRGFVTDDGSTTFFNSFATTLTHDDRNSFGDAFLRDRTTGLTQLLSVSWFGGSADGMSFRPVPDNDGSVATYLSQARNLVEGDPSTGEQVYAVSTATLPEGAEAADTTAPTVTVTSPQSGSAVASPVTLAGTASDDRGVDEVFVQVRDNATGLWLRADGTWDSGARRIPAAVADRSATSTTWSLPVSLAEGSYGFDVVALDAARNASTKPWTSFKVGVADTTAPTVSVTSPQNKETVGSPVTLRGEAADNRGVDKVFVQVRDNASGLWLRADGTWGTGARRIEAAFRSSSSDISTVDWSIELALADGSYGFDVIALDAAGNKSPKPWTSFRVFG